MISIVYCSDAFHAWPRVVDSPDGRCGTCRRGPDDHHIVKVQNYELDGHIAVCTNHECDWAQIREAVNSYARVLRDAEAHVGKGCGVVDADDSRRNNPAIHPHAKVLLRA